MKLSSRVFIGVGSNLDNPLKHILYAYESLKNSNKASQIVSSSIYQTPPIGPEQPHYLNSVVQLNFFGSAFELLRFLQLIEKKAGRNRAQEKRWGPRTLDLDILLFNNEIHNTEDLIIPHPGLLQRIFVLQPLAELVPDLDLGVGTAVELAHKLQDPQVKKLYDSNGVLYDND